MRQGVRAIVQVLLSVAVVACGTREASTAAAGSASPARSDLASSPSAASARPSPVTPAPAVADQAIAERLRFTGRTAFAICLYVDPATGLDAATALVETQDALDAVVRRGYTSLASRVSPCPQPPLYIRTGTVHFKNSASGPEAPVPRVRVPSEHALYLVVTTPSRIEAIFGGTIRRGTEEIACSGDNCAGVTESIYVDPAGFADPVARETLILDGLGLLGR